MTCPLKSFILHMSIWVAAHRQKGGALCLSPSKLANHIFFFTSSGAGWCAPYWCRKSAAVGLGFCLNSCWRQWALEKKNCSVFLLSYVIEKMSISDVTAANTAPTCSSLVATFVYKFAVARFLNLTHFSSKDAFWMAKNYWGRRTLKWACELLDLALQGYSLEYYFRIFIFGIMKTVK